MRLIMPLRKLSTRTVTLTAALAPCQSGGGDGLWVRPPDFGDSPVRPACGYRIDYDGYAAGLWTLGLQNACGVNYAGLAIRPQ